MWPAHRHSGGAKADIKKNSCLQCDVTWQGAAMASEICAHIPSNVSAIFLQFTSLTAAVITFQSYENLSHSIMNCCPVSWPAWILYHT